MRSTAQMFVAGSVALAGLALPAHAIDGHRAGDAPRVTQPVFDTRGAHSITANPDQGRLWYGHDFIGGQPAALPLRRLGPGPRAYGVPQSDDTLFLASYGSSVVVLSPWTRYPSVGVLRRLEDRRNEYLRLHGYTGGVRTFVNPIHRDAYLESAHGRRHAGHHPHAAHPAAAMIRAERAADGEIQPSATIRLSPEAPRFTPKMQVLNGPSRAVPGSLDLVILNAQGERLARRD